MQEQHYFTMALTLVKNIGPVLGKSLIQNCGSAEAVFKEKSKNLLKIEGVGLSLIQSLQRTKVFQRVDREIRYILDNDIHVLAYGGSDYPELLKHCFDAPLVLFYKGTLNGLKTRPISIVGTRQMTAYGREFLNDFMAELVPYNPTVLSGLAYGADIHAHSLALENQLATIAVLGHGFDTMYPASHAPIAHKMIQKKGGLITEFWSGSPPLKENFIKRNRIVAGLSQATIVIESALRGGSLITADFANSNHRDVFALPGRVTDIFSAGCNQLIKTNRAAVLTSVKDLSYLLNWEITTERPSISVQKKMFTELDGSERRIYEYLLLEGKQPLDLIALHNKYPIHKTASILLNLELKTLIRPLPGKYYEAI